MNETAPPRDYGFLHDAIEAADAVGAVHVGPGEEPSLRYLTGLATDRPVAVVVADGRAACCPPPGLASATRRTFPGVVRTADAGEPPGVRAARTLAALLGPRIDRDHGVAAPGDAGAVLAPSTIPHDAALFLEAAGFALESTAAIERARAGKRDAELAAMERVQRRAVRGIERARDLLAAATVEDGVLVGSGVNVDSGTPLTAERLRRAVDAALATAGVDPADGTTVAGGSDRRRDGDGVSPHLRAGEPIVVDVSPRGRSGYHADLARTLVVEGAGGWERRAHVACRAALRAGLAAVEPGAPASRVDREVSAELLAHGFGGEDGPEGRQVGHGIGLARHERPVLDRGDTLREGTVLAVEPELTDPEGGVVRLETVAAVIDDGAEVLAEHSLSMDPRDGG